MKKILILFCLLLAHLISLAQQPIRVRLSLIGNDTISFNKLVFGFDTLATKGLDTNLGEIEIPPLIPPSGVGVYGVFVFYDSISGENVWSYQDFRPFPLSYLDTVKFLVYVFRDFGIKLKFYWPSIGEEFRSAWLVDEYLGTLVQANMKEQNSIFIDNDFLDRFYIKVTLPMFSSVFISQEKQFRIEPGEQIIQLINPQSEFFYFEIYDVLCNLRIKGESSDEIVVLPKSNLGNGLFFIKLIDKTGYVTIRKVLLY